MRALILFVLMALIAVPVSACAPALAAPAEPAAASRVVATADAEITLEITELI